MISVTFTESGNKLSLRIEGHAGYAEHGQDIVCASASILAYTLAQTVMGAEHNECLVTTPVIQMDSGDTTISCEAKSNIDFAIVKCMFAFAIEGYRLLERNYPQHVKLNEGETRL